MNGEFIHEGIIHQEPLPRVALMNFPQSTQKLLVEKGHNVHLFSIVETDRQRQIVATKPAHEVEILIVNDSSELEKLPRSIDPTEKYRTQRPFSNLMASPTGHIMLEQYCRAVYQNGGVCVFFVSKIQGNLLAQSGLSINVNNNVRAFTKTASMKPVTHSGFEALSAFIEKYRKFPEVYVGISPTVEYKSFLEDMGGNNLVVLRDYVIDGVTVAGSGIVLCLPDYGDRPDILNALLTDVLPDLSSDLFPRRFDDTWKKEPAFLHPSVQIMESEKDAIRSKADEDIASLDKKIDAIIADDQFLMDLLLLGDDPLKKAVKKAIEELLRLAGIPEAEVVDVDEDPLHRDGSGQNREDLRLELAGHVILINVAGSDAPLKEGRINQVDKHQKLYLASHPEKVNKTHSVIIANYNKRGASNPLTRGQMFGSGTAQANERLKDAGHRAISTLDLFSVIRAAQCGDLKASQRELEALFLGGGILSIEEFLESFT